MEKLDQGFENGDKMPGRIHSLCNMGTSLFYIMGRSDMKKLYFREQLQVVNSKSRDQE